MSPALFEVGLRGSRGERHWSPHFSQATRAPEARGGAHVGDSGAGDSPASSHRATRPMFRRVAGTDSRRRSRLRHCPASRLAPLQLCNDDEGKAGLLSLTAIHLIRAEPQTPCRHFLQGCEKCGLAVGDVRNPRKESQRGCAAQPAPQRRRDDGTRVNPTRLVAPLCGALSFATIRGFLEDSSPTAIVVRPLRGHSRHGFRTGILRRQPWVEDAPVLTKRDAAPFMRAAFLRTPTNTLKKS